MPAEPQGESPPAACSARGSVGFVRATVRSTVRARFGVRKDRQAACSAEGPWNSPWNSIYVIIGFGVREDRRALVNRPFVREEGPAVLTDPKSESTTDSQVGARPDSSSDGLGRRRPVS